MKKMMFVIFAIGTLMFSGCSEETQHVVQEAETEVVTVPVTFRVDPVTNVSENEQFI